MDGKLRCLQCGLQPVENFRTSLKNGVTYFDSRCHVCRKAKMITHRVGMDTAEYLTLLAAWNHLCGICETRIEKPCLDHCHKSGKFRGFLCTACNTGLGQYRDNPDLLRLAADYLERTQPICLLQWATLVLKWWLSGGKMVVAEEAVIVAQGLRALGVSS